MSQDRHMELLGPIDSAFWYLDTPQTPMNIGSILIFDGAIDFNQLIRLIDSRIHQAPLYQQKVISAPFSLGEPMWVYDTEFHIQNHIFYRKVDAPGAEEQLRQTASKIMSRRLRRDKPLWEMYLLDGLEGGRCAVMFKVHHAMVDGISAIDLFSIMMDLSPEMPEIMPKPLYEPPSEPSTWQLLNQNTRKGLPHRWKMLKHIGNDAMNLGVNLLERGQRKKVLTGMLSVIHDHLTPIHPLAINGENTGRITPAWVEFPLDDVLAIRRKEKVSVNDIMVTLLGIAIERYGNDVDPENDQAFVRMIMPVNMRQEGAEENVGNRIAMLPVEVPFNTADVLDCLNQVSQYTAVMKDSELAKYFDILLSMPSFAHPTLQPTIWSLIPRVFSAVSHTWCTNVAGPSMPMYLLGREMLMAYGYLPLNPSMGLANTVLSYNGKITMTIAADTAIVQDVMRLRQHVVDAYRELCEATGIGLEQAAELVEEVAESAAIAHEAGEEAGVVSLNGVHDDEAPIVDESGVVVVAAPRFMSEAWAKALEAEINDSKAYYAASTKWTQGAVAMVMKAAPHAGYPHDEAVLLDLYKGKCRSATKMSAPEAFSKAAIVLESDYDTWMAVLERRVQAIPTILKGQIKLAKGSMRQLMPFTKSSQELVRCAIHVSHK